MLQKFVYWTGALDFVVGLAVFGGAISNQQPQQFVPLMTLGMFLCMAAACLMWASRDMTARYPVIFWQGLVRITAVCAVVYAVPNGLSETWELSVAAFDAVVGLAYVIGSLQVTGLSFISCLQCKAATE